MSQSQKGSFCSATGYSVTGWNSRPVDVIVTFDSSNQDRNVSEEVWGDERQSEVNAVVQFLSVYSLCVCRQKEKKKCL